MKPKSNATLNSTIRPAVPATKDQASKEGARAGKDTVSDKHGVVEQCGSNEEHAHAEKKRRSSKKVVFKSDSSCNDKVPMHYFADVPGGDGCTEDYHPSDAGAEK